MSPADGMQSGNLKVLKAAGSTGKFQRNETLAIGTQIDNLSVQKKVREAIHSVRWRTPQFFSTLWRELKQTVDSCQQPLHCYWVPSHGKHEEFAAPTGFETKHWRDLNADADEGAARTAQELWAR